jgi:MFS family permease
MKLPKTVVGLGIVSLLTDVSSESIFPLLPAFLAGLGASAAFIGAVEGMAELVANVIKYFAGVLADRRARLKPLVLMGYGLSTVVRPLMAFATVPWNVLAVRSVDRVGKGVRTSPRDSLIASVTDLSIRGRAYGFHRAMDNSGAAIGTLLSAGLLWLLGGGAGGAAGVEKMRTVFLWSAVPGILAIVALALTPEPEHAPRRIAPRPEVARERLPSMLKRALVAMVLFAIANATDAFILVKATKLGAPPTLAPLLWFCLQTVKAATNTTGGRIADRFGCRNALVLGWLVYAVTWGAVGFAGALHTLFVLTSIYGLSAGLVEGAERALVAELAAGHARGRAFGVFNMLIGLAALASSTAFGAVWDHWGSIAAFAGSAGFAAFAAVMLLALVPNRAPATTSLPG